MSLTTTQVSTLRLDSGDHIAPFLITYEEMALFDTQTGDYNHTVVKCIRLLIERLSASWEHMGDKRETTRIERRIDYLNKKLMFWEEQAGITGGAFQVGTVSLGIDQLWDESSE